MRLLSLPVSDMIENDLKFEWLLCLASTVEASRRQQIGAQAENFIATRPTSNKIKHDPNFERLLFLTSELQASQPVQAKAVGEGRQRPGPPPGATSSASS